LLQLGSDFERNRDDFGLFFAGGDDADDNDSEDDHTHNRANNYLLLPTKCHSLGSFDLGLKFLSTNELVVPTAVAKPVGSKLFLREKLSNCFI
jgi:hypothetical protein